METLQVNNTVWNLMICFCLLITSRCLESSLYPSLVRVLSEAHKVDAISYNHKFQKIFMNRLAEDLWYNNPLHPERERTSVCSMPLIAVVSNDLFRTPYTFSWGVSRNQAAIIIQEHVFMGGEGLSQRTTLVTLLTATKQCAHQALDLGVITVSGNPQQTGKEVDPNANSVNQFNHETSMPRFAEPIPNVTVSIGRDALLACVVDNLRGFKVAWVRVDTQTILSIHHNVITQNPRVTLSYNDHRSWYLHIRDVHEEDRGWYMCQVNTDPMRSRQGYLQVVVPPSIIDKETSTDMVVREASNATLICKAAGYPEPYVMWRREDGDDINYNGDTVNFIDGEVLHITRVSRLHMGAYLCIASNGVPPSISKRVTLKVQFPPMLTISNQLVGGYIGQDIKLECHTEAFPTSINFWTTEKGDMIVSGEKYEAISTDSEYNKYMILKIRKLSPQDFGSYKCVAKNSLGETDGFIKLDQIAVPSRPMAITEEPDDDRKDYDDGDNDGGNGGPSETVFNSLPTDNSSLNSDAVRWSHDGVFGWLASVGCCWMASVFVFGR